MNLAAERKKKGLTQASLSALSGISRAVIAGIERGTFSAAESTERRLTRALKEASPPAAQAFDMFDAAKEEKVWFLAPSPERQGEALREQRVEQGLSESALAKRMQVTKAALEATEAGNLALIDLAWAALERHREETWRAQGRTKLEAGPCGFCGKVHVMGQCK